MIEKDFEIPFIADLARREKQIQQNYRPIIAVHNWFARRPGTLFRGLILSEFSEKPLHEVYYTVNNLSGLHIADPFMGDRSETIFWKNVNERMHRIKPVILVVAKDWLSINNTGGGSFA